MSKLIPAIRITGDIDENTNFIELIGKYGSDIILNCSGVRRINSAGIRSWTRFFTELRKKGVKFKVEECAFALVQPASMISGFLNPDEIGSLQLPYVCSKCKKESVFTHWVEQLRMNSFNVPDMPCTHCGGTAAFDELPVDFFKFLRGTHG